MSEFLEICLEELDAPADDACYIRCVVMAGGQPGLALDRDGLVRWMPEDEGACHGLWLSEDGRLVLHGAATTAAVTVERGARSVQAPVGQPVVLLDQDLLRVGDRRLRLHIHGETEQLHEPERLTRSAMRRFLQAAAAAATLTLGGAGLAAGPGATEQSVLGDPTPIEVRRRPPKVSPRTNLDCNVSTQWVKKGKLRIKALCASTQKLRVGQYGILLDKKNRRPISKGTVKITAIKGSAVYIEATYLKKKKASLGWARFWVSRY